MAEKFNYFFLNKIIILFIILEMPKVINEELNEIMILINSDNSKEIINQRYYNNISSIFVNGTESNLFEYKNYLDKGVYAIIIKFINKLNSCEYMFFRLNNILSIDISNFDSSNVKSMSHMFRHCNLLKSLDLDKLNTSSVTNMEYMFYNCYELISLQLNSLDTSLVTNMAYMFYDCNNLKSLDLSSFNTSLVTDMYKMFYECMSLESLDLSNFNTSLVTNMAYMFYFCKNIKILDLGNFNTSLVNNMNYMFYNCHILISLDLSNFNTSLVTNMDAMFESCNAISSLDLSNFNTSLVTNTAYMFYNCYALIYLKIDQFNLSSISKCEDMFYDCRSLSSLNLTNFYTLPTLSYTYYMFNKINRYLTYCIDNQKEYAFINELKNFNNNCSEICINYNLKKYIFQNNTCIDNCTLENIFKYEYNNICYERCPNNTILGNDSYYCIPDKAINEELNSDNMINDSDNESKYWIIVLSFILIILIIAIPTIIIKKKNSIKVIFSKNQINTEIYVNQKTPIGKLIEIYFKKKNIRNKGNFGFLLNGVNLSTEDKRKEIRNYLPKFIKTRKIKILVNEFSDVELSTVLIENDN